MASSLPAAKGETILISGINGYIAAAVGLAVLEKGYDLVGTARTKASAQPLVNATYKQYAEAGRVKILEVPDITVEGAFDEAVKGINIILHLASPFDYSLKKPAEVFPPAIKGSVSILQSAQKYGGPELRQVIVLSSVAAITEPNPKTPDYQFTEADWNDFGPIEVAKHDPNDEINPNILYSASKSAAERAVWKFRDEWKPPYDIVSINATFVYGPPAYLPSDSSKISQAIKPVLAILKGEWKSVPPKLGSGGYVDIRDVVLAHLWAIENPKIAKDERWIVLAGSGPPQATVDILRKAYPEKADVIPLGEPGTTYDPVHYGFVKGGISVSSEKLEKEFRKAYGEQWKGWIKYDKSVIDTAKVLERYLE